LVYSQIKNSSNLIYIVYLSVLILWRIQWTGFKHGKMRRFTPIGYGYSEQLFW